MTTPPLTGGAVRRRIEELAPPALAESWDNVGWMVGHDHAAVRAILVTLDVEARVVQEAADRGANLIVAHHPLIFRGLRTIDPANSQGRLLRRLLCEEISVYAAHTNLDAVRGGVNDALVATLGLTAIAPLSPVRGAPDNWGFGAICEVAEGISTANLARRAAERLGAPQVRVTPGLDAPDSHTRVALLGGSGASFIPTVAAADCTLYLTGEVKYHEAQDAAQLGITLIETDHFYSERPVIAVLADWLRPLGVPVFSSDIITSPFISLEELLS